MLDGVNEDVYDKAEYKHFRELHDLLFKLSRDFSSPWEAIDDPSDRAKLKAKYQRLYAKYDELGAAPPPLEIDPEEDDCNYDCGFFGFLSYFNCFRSNQNPVLPAAAQHQPNQQLQPDAMMEGHQDCAEGEICNYHPLQKP